LLLAGVFSLLLFAPLAFGSTDPWAIFVLQAGTALLLALWVVRQRMSPDLIILTNPLFAPMLAFAALVLIQIVFHRSAYLYQTLADVLLYFSYGTLAFLAVQTVRRGSHIRRLAVVFTIYGTAVALFALFQSITSSGKIYWTWAPEFGGWIYGPYVNHNHYAGLMEMLVPIPLVAAFTPFLQGRDKILAACAAAIMAGTIFLSGSRGGMLAVMVEIGVMIGLLTLQKRDARSGLILGAFLIVLLGVIAWVGGGEIASRLGTIGTEARHELDGGMRLGIDRDGLRMFTHRPLLGWGLGTFPIVYPEFRSFSTTFFVNEAHNDYVQLLVEMGAAGFVLMLWFLVQFYRHAARKLQGREITANGALALAAVLGCTGILVHSFLDFNLQIPANAALFYTLATLGAAKPVPESTRRKKSNSLLIEEVWATPA
jgi:O-antigen ligase